MLYACESCDAAEQNISAFIYLHVELETGFGNHSIDILNVGTDYLLKAPLDLIVMWCGV